MPSRKLLYTYKADGTTKIVEHDNDAVTDNKHQVNSKDFERELTSALTGTQLALNANKEIWNDFMKDKIDRSNNETPDGAGESEGVKSGRVYSKLITPET